MVNLQLQLNLETPLDVYKRYILSLILLPIGLVAKLNGPNDFQIWNHDTLEKKINELFDVRLESEFRWGDDATELWLVLVEGYLVYHHRKYLNIASGYRQTWVKGPKKWRTIFIPTFDLTLQTYGLKWHLSNRNRVQLLFPEHHSLELVYRNKTVWTSPWEWTQLKLKPFLGNELFFAEKKGFFENRFDVGFHLPIVHPLTGKLYYRLITVDREHWINIHVLAIDLHLKF